MTKPGIRMEEANAGLASALRTIAQGSIGGLHPIAQAKIDYIRGRIEVDELERRVEAALRGR